MFNRAQQNEVKRVGRFGLVGILNTLIDVGLLNLLKFKFGMGVPFPANFISTSVAMTFSFFANRQLVFQSQQRTVAKQVLLFFGVTAFGLYGLQTGVIKLFSEVWLWPVETALNLVDLLRLSGIFGDEFVRLNFVKALAIATSMVWNYTMYKKVVFKQ